ncbi:MAG: serine protease [Bacteroidales bacterium]|nr:serine protease [Bacteroidales bacterium]
MFLERVALYEQLEESRQSKVLVYATSDKRGMETQIAEDTTEYFIEHLDKIGVVKKITLVLHTSGGSTLAAWNIVNLIRQFCDDFEIIVPVKARSAGTLMCLAANRIVMTKQATLGPIDPSVNTPLNPHIEGAGPLARMPVSVEAIKGFLELAKKELNIRDDKALASVFLSLSEKVHPLALGEVYRAISQIQMLAEKLLRNQISDEDKIKRIVAFLCSESGSHDYTINRREARNSLGLNIETPDYALYECIRSIYQDIKTELDLGMAFDPNSMLAKNSNTNYCIRRGLVESLAGKTDAFITQGTLTRIVVPNNPHQSVINDQRTFEGWKHYE